MCECHVRRHGRHSIFSRRFSRVQTGKAGWGVFQVVLGAVEKNKAGTGRAGRGCDFKEGMEEGVRQQRPEGGEEAASRAGVGEGGF